MRITSIDGFSERLRRLVNKPITRGHLRHFFDAMSKHERPHEMKIYNIVGYPTESEEEWWEFIEDMQEVDSRLVHRAKQWSILLHNTPFRAMPATPAACWSMSYKNYRGRIAQVLGAKYKGNIIYQGNAFWSVESSGTESLPTVTLSAIALRGTEADQENVKKIALSKSFWSANMAVKQATLERYFDVAALFRPYTTDELPTRNIKTYLPVEGAWTRS